MKTRKICVLLLVLSLCVLLCACDISGMFNRGQDEPQQENSFIRGESDIQLQPDDSGNVHHFITNDDGSMTVIIGGETDKGGISVDTEHIFPACGRACAMTAIWSLTATPAAVHPPGIWVKTAMPCTKALKARSTWNGISIG